MRTILALVFLVSPLTAIVIDDEELMRGDVNDDATVDISDDVYLRAYLLTGGSAPLCLDAADANDDGAVDLSDSVYLLYYLLLGGEAPPAPGPSSCGEDPTEDSLGCVASQCGS